MPKKERLFKDMDEVRSVHRARGGAFFSESNMRFFGSRIEGGLRGGKYFITSETWLNDGKRKYTVREVLPNGDITNVGDLDRFLSYEDAAEAMREVMSGAPDKEKLY